MQNSDLDYEKFWIPFHNDLCFNSVARLSRTEQYNIYFFAFSLCDLLIFIFRIYSYLSIFRLSDFLLAVRIYAGLVTLDNAYWPANKI